MNPGERMHRLIGLTLLLVTLLPAASRAHQGGTDAKGVVKEVAADHITIIEHGDETATFALTPRTEFVVGTTPAKREEIRSGWRVVIHAKKMGGRLEAVLVRTAAG